MGRDLSADITTTLFLVSLALGSSHRRGGEMGSGVQEQEPGEGALGGGFLKMACLLPLHWRPRRAQLGSEAHAGSHSVQPWEYGLQRGEG